MIYQLIYMGRDYPKDPEIFRVRCHNVFIKNKDVTDSKEIEELIAKGNYIVKEFEDPLQMAIIEFQVVLEYFSNFYLCQVAKTLSLSYFLLQTLK